MKKYKMIGIPTLIGTSHQDLREVTKHRDAFIKKYNPAHRDPDQITVSFTIIPENGIIEPGDLHEIAEHLEKYFNEIE